MLRLVVEEIEHLHGAAAAQRERPQSARLETSLADCLQQLRAIAAREARGRLDRRPLLRVI